MSKEQVAAADELGVQGVQEGDLRTALCGLPNDGLDAIVAFDVIEHLSTDELLEFSDQALRVLAPGGRLIVHVPNGESPFFGRVRYGDVTHERAFTRRSITQLMSTAGFHLVRCYSDTPVVHGPVSLVRWLLWNGIRLVLWVVVAAETVDIDRRAIFTQNLLAVAFKPEHRSAS